MRPSVGERTFSDSAAVSLPVYGMKDPSPGIMMRSTSLSSTAPSRVRQQKWMNSAKVSGSALKCRALQTVVALV